MAAVTRLGLSATPWRLYGSFAGKTEAVAPVSAAVEFGTRDVTLAVRNILRGEHTFTDARRNAAQQKFRSLVEDRVFVGRAPQKVDYPYALISFVDVQRGYHLLGELDTTFSLVEIQVYSRNRRQMFLGWDAARQCLSNYKGTVATKDGDVEICSCLLDGEGEDSLDPVDGSGRHMFQYSGVFRIVHDQVIPGDYNDEHCGIGCMIIESTFIVA